MLLFRSDLEYNLVEYADSVILYLSFNYSDLCDVILDVTWVLIGQQCFSSLLVHP